MTRAEAHQLLDAARAGLEVSRHGITEALCATGDLDPGWRRPATLLPSQVLPADPPSTLAWQPSERLRAHLRNAPYHRSPEAA